MAETLGCGIPVVINEGIGDTAEIIRKHNVGIVVQGTSISQMEDAFKSLSILLKDPNLGNRCRKTAENLFSLKHGTDSYRKIYNNILCRRR